MRTLCVRVKVDIRLDAERGGAIGEDTGRESGFGGRRTELARTRGEEVLLDINCPRSLDLALSLVNKDGGPTRVTEEARNLALPNVSGFESCVVDTDIVLAMDTTLASMTLTRFFTLPDVAITG